MTFIQTWNWRDNIDEYMDIYFLNQELVHEDDDCLKYDFHLFRRDVYTNKFNFIETLNWSQLHSLMVLTKLLSFMLSVIN